MRSASCVFACVAGALLTFGTFARPAGAQVPAPGTTASPHVAAAPPAPTLVPPRLITEVTVPYPDGATGDATVVLTLTIDEDGLVRAAVPAEPDSPFAVRAAQVARMWHFEPATRDGKPVLSRIRMEVVFHAPEVAAPTEDPARATAARTNKGAASLATTPIDVHVLGERPDPSRTVSLSRTEVRQIPGVFGDPFRAIEIMPGVTPIISGLPFFFVRGAPPGDVGYFLDGVRVPYLFHVGAGPSVIHPAIIDKVDLYPGGYPARFGRFSGGIVDGETAAPGARAHGEANVRVFDTGLFLETPFDDGRGDLTLAGRYSYTAALLTLLASNVSLNYWDYQARLGFDLTPRDRISVFSFGAHDFLGNKNDGGGTNTLFGATFHRVDLRYDHRIDGDGTLRIAVTGGLDRTALDDTHYVQDRLVGARAELTYRLSPVALLRAGIDGEADRYDVLLSDASDDSGAAVAALFPSRTDLSVGTRADVVLSAGPRLEITPGMRLDAYASEGATALGVDPRLATRTVLTDHVRLLGAMGVAHQIPAFVVPVPGFQPGGLQGGLQTALQESAGIEADLMAAITMTATLYHNAFFNLSDALSVNQAPVNGCGSGSIAGSPLGGSGNSVGCTNGQTVPSGGDYQTAQALSTRSNGSAYGLEIFLKRRLTEKLGGFVSYTLSRSVRTADNEHFIAPFDRTHVANAALAYDLGRGWRAGIRGLFYTGLPKAPDPSDPGSTRLSPFIRLDLRLEKRWQLGPRAWISFVAEWMNATLSKESIGTNCTLQGCQEERIGPVTIPSLGVEAAF